MSQTCILYNCVVLDCILKNLKIEEKHKIASLNKYFYNYVDKYLKYYLEDLVKKCKDIGIDPNLIDGHEYTLNLILKNRQIFSTFDYYIIENLTKKNQYNQKKNYIYLILNKPNSKYIIYKAIKKYTRFFNF